MLRLKSYQKAVLYLLLFAFCGGILWFVAGEVKDYVYDGQHPHLRDIQKVTQALPAAEDLKSGSFSIDDASQDKKDANRMTTVTGWAFDPSTGRAPFKMVLQSSSCTYTIAGQTKDRGDVVDALAKEGMKLSNSEVGFTFAFPATGIQPGVYRIGFLFGKEGDSRFAWTDRQLDTRAGAAQLLS